MTTPSAKGDAAALLHNSLLEHFELCEALADHDTWNDEQQESVRTALTNLATLARTILAGHKAPHGTNCLACQQPWPCAELRAIHGLVKDPETTLLTLMSRERDHETECLFV